jgi:hypothetical protein
MIAHDFLRISALLACHLVSVRQDQKTQKTSMELAMKSNSAAQPELQSEASSLDRRYGKIGISAVAAALPYQSDAKNPAYAPVVPRSDEKRLAEMAA